MRETIPNTRRVGTSPRGLFVWFIADTAVLRAAACGSDKWSARTFL